MNVTEEYCWAITQAMGWACCGRSGSSVLGTELQLDVLLYKYVCILKYGLRKIRLAPAVTDHNYCLSQEYFYY